MGWDVVVSMGFTWAIGGALFNFVIFLISLVTGRFTWPAWPSILGGAIFGLALGAVFGALLRVSQYFGLGAWIALLFVAGVVVAGLGTTAAAIQQKKTRAE